MNIKSLTSILVAMAFVVALSPLITWAQSWTAPVSTPPAGNAAAPIDVSSGAQIKAGGLSLGSLSITGGSTFTGNSIFSSSLCLGGVCKSAWPTASSTITGGTCAVGSYVTSISTAGVPNCTAPSVVAINQPIKINVTTSYVIPSTCPANASLHILSRYTYTGSPSGPSTVRYVSGGVAPTFASFFQESFDSNGNNTINAIQLNLDDSSMFGATAITTVPISALGGPGATVSFLPNGRWLWILGCQ